MYTMSSFIKATAKASLSVTFAAALSFFTLGSTAAAAQPGATSKAVKEQCKTRCLNQIDARTDAENTCTLKYGDESSQDKDNCILLETESNIRDCVKACQQGQ